MTAQAQIRIFKVNECDWFAAASLDDAKKAVLETFGPPVAGQSLEEFWEEFLDEPHELDDAAVDRLKFSEEDEPPHSFREELNRRIATGHEFPSYFASTEC